MLLSVDGHLNCFAVGAITHNATMNISTQVFVWMYVFILLGYIPRSGFAASCGNSMFNILRN